MFHILVLVLALCMDTFVASMAYGANKVHITWEKIVVMNAICSGCLGIALAAGSVLDGLVPESMTRMVCFISLFLLGVVKLLDYTIKKYINRHVSLHKGITFSFSGLRIIVNIYGDPMAADWDHSQSLSWKEVLFLSFAMSIDSLIAGALSAFLEIPVGLTMGTALIMGIVMMYAGLFLGRKLASRCKCDLSWISGVLFMILAVTKSLS
ncbi:manganese efflux pump [Hungatella hominis]|uniref:Manganese efflux pump n=1 Tax=Hungatella hominis TaxID=2763050 RepID=A0ABR7HDJ3_9FIRM|nr:manganese efflux pump [Hungatella hominis]MBC5711256.1 manganese efflux pump [Hungatella hominis]